MRFAIVKNEKVIEIIEAEESIARSLAAIKNAEAWHVPLDCVVGMNFVNGIYNKIVEEQKPDLIAPLKYAISLEIERLNVKYPGLNLDADDDITDALPKFFINNVLKEDTIYISSYYNLLSLLK